MVSGKVMGGFEKRDQNVNLVSRQIISNKGEKNASLYIKQTQLNLTVAPIDNEANSMVQQ